MGSILVKALSLVMVIVIGFAIKKIGWVSVSDFPKFSKIVINITVPCTLITNFNNFKISYNLFFLIVVGFVVNLIQEVVGYMINLKNGRRDQAFGILNIGSYNVGAFAMPYISGFIGGNSMIFASLFDMGNSIAAAGISYGWAMSLAKENKKTSLLSFAKNMLRSPIFDTYLFLITMNILNVHLPETVITFTSTVGSANTFLAMLMIGIGLELNLNPIKFYKAFRYLLIRYGFAIIFTSIVAFLMPFQKDAKIVLCMLFFSPIAAMIAGFTSEAKGDVETSSFMTSVSIIIGIIVMPLILFIMK